MLPTCSELPLVLSKLRHPVSEAFQLEETRAQEEPTLPKASVNCLELLNIREGFSAFCCH